MEYKKEKYSDIRVPIEDDVFIQLLKDTLKANKIEADEDVCRRVFVSMLAGVAYYLYEYPEYYINLTKMVMYREANLKNLFVLEAKEGENAASIMKYYLEGGAFSEELEKLIKNFIQGLLKNSQKSQDKVSEEIVKLEKLTKRDSE